VTQRLLFIFFEEIANFISKQMLSNRKNIHSGTKRRTVKVGKTLEATRKKLNKCLWRRRNIIEHGQ
jgi:hypothetical protein